MTQDELLQDRYEVLSPWPPNNLFKAGDIVEPEQFTGWHPKDYPVLFRRVNWWEYRAVEDMPEYVITNYIDEFKGKGVLQNGMVFKVEQWATQTFPTIKEPQLLANLEGYTPDYLWRTPEQKTGRVNCCHLLPATEQQYIDYQKSISK